MICNENVLFGGKRRYIENAFNAEERTASYNGEHIAAFRYEFDLSAGEEIKFSTVTGLCVTTDEAKILTEKFLNGEEKAEEKLAKVKEFFARYTENKKTFSGDKIYGDGRKRDWQYYLGGHRYDFYNPIMQNKRHVEYLRKMLSDFAEVEFYSVVLMLCDDCKVSNVNRSDRVDTVVCTSLPAMNRAMKMFLEANETKLSPADTRKIYDYISNPWRIF